MIPAYQSRLLAASERHLEECHSRLKDETGAATLESGEGLALLLGLRLGIQSTQAARLLLENQLNVPACAVARGFIELSIRLLWATRAENGWNRLLGFLAKEHLRWAERCVNVFGMQRTDFPCLDDAEIERLASTRPCMPDLASLLRQVREADAAEGLIDSTTEASPDHEYVGQFLFLHPAAHGHPSFVDAPAADETWGVDFFLGVAAVRALRAVYHFKEWEYDRTVMGLLAEVDHRCQAEGWQSPNS